MARRYATKVKMTIEGAKELDKLLDNMGDSAAVHVDDAVRTGGQIALAAARANADTEFENPTGETRDAIQLQPVTLKRGQGVNLRRIVRGSVKLGFDKSAAGRKAVRSKKKFAFHGIYQELGTKYFKPKYFLRDAIDKNKDKISEAITSRFKRLLRG